MYDLLLFASLILFAGVAVAYARHPASSLTHPATFYLAFHGFIFVVRPIIARLFDFSFVYRLYDFLPSMEDKATVILAANLAMLVFVGASLYVARQPPMPIERRDYGRVRAHMAKPIAVVVILLAPIAVWSQLMNWQRRQEEFGTMIRDAATGTAFNTESIGWLTDAALMLAPLTVMIIWLARYRWWSWAVFALFLILQAGDGTRGPIVFAAAALAILVLLETRRPWLDWRVTVLALSALLAFTQIVVDRGAGLRSTLGQSESQIFAGGAELAPLEGMDFANLEYFEYIVYAVPQRTGTYDYFAGNLQIFTEPVPRALWKDKPIGSPVRTFSLWDYGRPIGMTASVPGAGWMSLGYPGVAIQALFFALLYAFGYRIFLQRKATPLAQLAYALLMATAFNVLRDGTLLTFVRQVPFHFGPLLLSLLALRILGPSRIAQAHAWQGPVREFLAQTPAERRRTLAAQSSDQR